MFLKASSGLFLLLALPLVAQEQPSPATRAEELLSKMSLEQKVGQMNQLTFSAFESSPGVLDKEKLRRGIVEIGLGSMLNLPSPGAPTPEGWAKILGQIEELISQSALKIPVLYGIDSIHGASFTAGATFFPQQIGLAATWEPELARQAAEVTAYETRASSIPWVFAPDLDLSRNPAWPRLWETFGQDPYLISRFGVAFVEGFQGRSLNAPNSVAACVKHFAGYGSPTTGRDRTPTLLPERLLRQEDFPPFQAAIEAGARSIMVSSGEINGTPIHASKRLLTDILQVEMGFKGLILTDWEDIIYLHQRHKVAATLKDAVRIAINAGIDMSMVPNDYHFHRLLLELVHEGQITEKRIDHSVRKILTLKYELGLFDRSLVAAGADYPDFASEKATQLAYQSAAESITLLRNDQNVLPLSKETRLLVTGPTADTMRSLNGGWSYTWQGEKSDKFAKEKLTVLEAATAGFGKDRVTYSPGVTFDGQNQITDAVAAASKADAILVCLGENSYTETPGDLSDLSLPWPQQDLALQMTATGKPVIVLFLAGRPRTIAASEGQLPTILHGYLPGNEGARAIIDVILGKVNPSGCLPYVYPRHPNALQRHNHKATENLPGEVKNYDPLFDFGHGLSYTTFSVSDLSVSTPVFEQGATLQLSAKIKNTGPRLGKKVVQLYLRDHYASITPGQRELRGFQKIELEPNEERTVTFKLEPRAFEFVNHAQKWVAEPGRFTLSIDQQKVEVEMK